MNFGTRMLRKCQQTVMDKVLGRFDEHKLRLSRTSVRNLEGEGKGFMEQSEPEVTPEGREGLEHQTRG